MANMHTAEANLLVLILFCTIFLFLGPTRNARYSDLDRIFMNCERKASLARRRNVEKVWMCVYWDAGILRNDGTLDKNKYIKFFGHDDESRNNFEACKQVFGNTKGPPEKKLSNFRRCTIECSMIY